MVTVVRSNADTIARDGEERTHCLHHWFIEAATGPTSRGTCRRCDAVREFKNYIEVAPWGEDSPLTAGLPQWDAAPVPDSWAPEDES